MRIVFESLKVFHSLKGGSTNDPKQLTYGLVTAIGRDDSLPIKI